MLAGQMVGVVLAVRGPAGAVYRANAGGDLPLMSVLRMYFRSFSTR